MFIKYPLPFVRDFVDELNDALRIHTGHHLTRLQKTWLWFCLMGIVLTNTVCWAKFERASLGTYTISALSWIFRKAKIPWNFLLSTSVILITEKYGITEGKLVIDDSDHKRSKCTTRIFKAYKLKDKTTGGYVNGQTIVLLLLVTEFITIPVGFEFYMPDPAQKDWDKEDKRLKKQGVIKKYRPTKPEPNPKYPTKQQLALRLLQEFKRNHGKIKIKVILADALYGIGKFMDEASKLFNNVQVISQLRNNQNVHFRNKVINVKKYFTSYGGVPQTINIRGDFEITAIVNSARLYVTAHGKKRFIIAIKYEGEAEYRYLVATDLSWRTIDIIQAYSLRWLVEVFFEDWKLYEGWGQEAKQPDYEGSSRSLILSLLLDHCLFLHPEQLARVKNKLPAYTVGSLQRRTQVDIFLAFVRTLLEEDDPSEKLEQFAEIAKEFFQLMPSKKHMSGRNLGTLEPTPSLKYKAIAAQAG